jgi:phage tail-like protein
MPSKPILSNRKPAILYDHLQNFPFWIMDVSPVDTLALPIFLPLFGFSAISAPEVTASIRTVKEGNNYFPRKVIESASVGPITCSRGAHFVDGDFWRWIKNGIRGTNDGAGGPTYRRNLLLVQFFARGPFREEAANIAIAATGLVGLASGASVLGSDFTTVGNATGTGVSAGLSAGGFLGFSALSGWAVRIPAKAWLLYDCIPARYKVGTGFDAASPEVSIAELDIEMESFEEIGLAS